LAVTIKELRVRDVSSTSSISPSMSRRSSARCRNIGHPFSIEAYLAPEQRAGRSTPDSDLYSLGMVRLVVLTRRPPTSLDEHDPARDYQGHPAMVAILRALLAQRVEDRPTDAREAHARLVRIRKLIADSQQLQPPLFW